MRLLLLCKKRALGPSFRLIFGYAARPRRKAFLFSSRNLGGTVASSADSQSASGISIYRLSTPTSTTLTALGEPASMAMDRASMAVSRQRASNFSVSS